MMSTASNIMDMRYVHGRSVESLDVKRYEEIEAAKVPRWRRYLSQFVAAFSINLLLFDIGLALSYPTLVVPVLQQNPSANEHEGFGYNVSHIHDNFTVVESLHNETSILERDHFHDLPIFKHFTLSKEGITWYVSIVYIFQPIGSILGGSIIGVIGRKRLMQSVNIFIFCGWLLPFFSTSPIYMYFSNILFGIGIGCSEAPISTYIGEITEISTRGVILTLSHVFLSVSFLIPYLISLAVPSWRWIALTLSCAPVVAFIVCSIVPETPPWLLSKHRYMEAEASLKWLRGWTSSDQVKEELEEISSHHLDTKRSNNDLSTGTSTGKSTEELVEGSWLKENVQYFCSYRMRRPFIIVCVLFALIYISGMCAIRPYLVNLFHTMKIKMDEQMCALWVTLAGVVGNIVALFLVRYSGKRFIVLSGLSGSAVCTLVIALINMGILPTQFSFIMFIGMSFFSGYGIVPLPWILQNEVYPFRGRGFAGGLGAAFSYLVGFVSTKSYPSLVDLITLQGVFSIFTCFSVMGLIYLWIKLPETEGKSFQEIDQYFSRPENKSK